MGLSGTGKSTLGAAIADAVDAVVLRSDVIRKRTDATPGDAAARYAPSAKAAVYETLAAEADAALGEGRSVIADATFIRRVDRDRLRTVAARRGVACVFVECRSDPEIVRARLSSRTSADVSDARWETYLEQRRTAEPFGDDEPQIVVATDGTPAQARADTLAALWAWRRAARR
jgi:predicted kinase